MQVSFCSVPRRVDLGGIHSSIAQDLESDWSTQITWKRQPARKYKYWLVYSNTRAEKCFSCYLFWSLWGRRFIFIKQISRQAFFSMSLRHAVLSKRDSDTDVSREFYEIWKRHVYTFINIIFTEQLRTAASVFIEQF